MMPMEPEPEEWLRYQAEQRRRMMEARAVYRLVHSRTGLLTGFVRRLADQIDPSGRMRRTIR